MEKTKTVGENKLEKLVRLMKRYQEQIEIMEGTVAVTVRADNTAAVFIMPESPINGGIVTAIYRGDVNSVIEFLEAGQLKRTLMVRG